MSPYYKEKIRENLHSLFQLSLCLVAATLLWLVLEKYGDQLGLVDHALFISIMYMGVILFVSQVPKSIDTLFNWLNGLKGENMTAKLINNNFISPEYKYIRDIKMNTQENIDGILIHEHGVIVIETKYHHGKFKFIRDKIYSNHWRIGSDKIPKQVVRQEEYVREILQKNNLKDVHVTAMIAFMSGEITRTEHPTIFVSDKENLVSSIQNRISISSHHPSHSVEQISSILETKKP